MNPQPVSLADESRKLVEKWRRTYEEGQPIGSKGAFTYDIEKRCADELSALLDQHAVAEPMLTFEKWFSLWDTTHDVEVKRLCEITWRVASQHAAEQPKLTAEQVRSFFLQHNIVVWERPASWCCHCGRWVLDSKLNDELVMRKSWAEHCVEEFAALLTSPVAPPPRNEIPHEPAGKWTLRCKICKQEAMSWDGVAHLDSCPQKERMAKVLADYDAAQYEPPIAPGEQPPRPSDREEGK